MKKKPTDEGEMYQRSRCWRDRQKDFDQNKVSNEFVVENRCKHAGDSDECSHRSEGDREIIYLLRQNDSDKNAFYSAFSHKCCFVDEN